MTTDWKLDKPTAVFSDDRAYRYQLTRFVPKFGLTDGVACWIMLNPSTADETVNDPTIRRCIDFTVCMDKWHCLRWHCRAHGVIR